MIIREQILLIKDMFKKLRSGKNLNNFFSEKYKDYNFKLLQEIGIKRVGNNVKFKNISEGFKEYYIFLLNYFQIDTENDKKQLKKILSYYEKVEKLKMISILYFMNKNNINQKNILLPLISKRLYNLGIKGRKDIKSLNSFSEMKIKRKLDSISD